MRSLASHLNPGSDQSIRPSPWQWRRLHLPPPLPTPPYTRLGAETAHNWPWRKLQVKASPSTLQAALFLRRPVLCAWGPPCRGRPGPIPLRCLCETPLWEVDTGEGCRGGQRGRAWGRRLEHPFLHQDVGTQWSSILVLLFPLLPSFDEGSLGLMLRCFSSIFGIFALVYILNIWVSLGLNKTVKKPLLFWKLKHWIYHFFSFTGCYMDLVSCLPFFLNIPYLLLKYWDQSYFYFSNVVSYISTHIFLLMLSISGSIMFN